MSDELSALDDITFRSDMLVKVNRVFGSDLDVAQAAWVDMERFGKDDELRKLIGTLMKGRHGVPFETCVIQFFINVPIFVAREIVRHRIATIDEYSGRYKEMKPDFWIPAKGRGMTQVGTSMRPKLEENEDKRFLLGEALEYVGATGWQEYQNLLREGVVKEAARTVLPINIYTEFFWTVNLRSLMNFLSLRIDDPRNTYKTYPMAEIQQAALACEGAFATAFPIVAEKFIEHGRVAP